MMILGANARAMGSHVGGWRHPDAWYPTVMNLENTVLCAQLAEQGKMHFVFLADGNGVRQMDKPTLFAATSPTDRPSVFEPVTLLSAISMVTKHVGLVATATTTYEEPFSLARKFASLDHLSNGRAGWNLVTTSNAEDALNFGRTEHMARDVRYQRAREFAKVVRGLWDSWADGAFIQDQATGQFLDPTKLHVLNHKGEFFSVRGPLNMARPPQGHPIIFSAGQSDAGMELTASTSDCMFATGATKEDNIATYNDIKGRMAKYGRSPDSLKILPNVVVYVGKTRDEINRHHDELQALIPPALGLDVLSKAIEMDLDGYPLDGPVPEVKGQHVGGTSGRFAIVNMARQEGLTIRQTYERIVLGAGGCVFKGDPIDVADQMEDWYRSKACDGFVLSGPVMPRGLKDFVELVIPELQKRGVFHADYEGKTFRDNLGLTRPSNEFFSTGVAAE